MTTGRIAGNRWVIENGIQAGEQVIVEGFQKLRPGANVVPQPWKDPSAKSTAGAKK